MFIMKNSQRHTGELVSKLNQYSNTKKPVFYILFDFAGCDLIFFLAAFPISIGSQYWELLHRTRAVDNQLFVAAVSPARNEQASYVVYGHSMIIDPTGNVLTKAETGEEIVFYEIGLTQQSNSFECRK